jgi:hypothetical protein
MVLSAEQHEKLIFIPSFKLRNNITSGKYVIILHTWTDGNYIKGCDQNINVGVVLTIFSLNWVKFTVA